MTDEQFAQGVMRSAELGAIDGIVSELVLGDHHQLGWMANRRAGACGTWRLTNIEGAVPGDLEGVLYRIAPGQKRSHGVQLMDFFDGDAFLSAFAFENGRVTLRARFVGSPQRHRETAAGKMIYNEFGTLAPRHRHWWSIGTYWKNPPSVNVIQWNGRLLGLSEGGHPTAIGYDLRFQTLWDFHGTLPWYCAFTAHPKFDPTTGEGFAYGYTKSPIPSLRVFRMNPENGKLEQIHKLREGKYFMVHDMVLTEKHVVLIIPPVKLNFLRAVFLPETLAENLRYFENEPTRILVLSRSGAGDPIEIELEPNMVFHHGNGFEGDRKLILDSLMYPDGTILELVRCWSKVPPPSATGTRLTRIEIDLDAKTADTQILRQDVELPRFDERHTGTHARFLYMTRESTATSGDPYGAEMFKFDTDGGSSTSYRASAPNEAFGEPVFVPSSGTGTGTDWILMLGYSGERDETFLDILDAATVQRQARVWTGTHVPLGFHGNFYPAGATNREQ